MNPSSQTVARRVAGHITAATTLSQTLPPYYHYTAHQAHSRISLPRRDTRSPYAPRGVAKRDPLRAQLRTSSTPTFDKRYKHMDIAKSMRVACGERSGRV